MKKFTNFNFDNSRMDREWTENGPRMDRSTLATMCRYIAVMVMVFGWGIGEMWGDTYLDNHSTPSANSGLLSKITVTSNVSFNNSSLQIGTNGASGSFTVESLDGSYIDSIVFSRNGDNYSVGSLTVHSGTTGTITNRNSGAVWKYVPSSSVTTATLDMSAPSGGKTRLAPVKVYLKNANYEYFTQNFSSSGSSAPYTITGTKSNGSSDVTITANNNSSLISSNAIQLGSGKQLTITSSGHNIKSIHFSCVNHGSMSNISANTGTYSSNGWTKSTATNTVTFTSSGSNANIVGISVELEAAKAYTVTTAVYGGVGGTVAAGDASLDKDETTTITATSATGYQVTNWAVSGTGASISPSGASNSNTTTLTMGTANATVTATFGLIDYTVTKTLTNCAVKDGSTAIPSTMNYGDDLSTTIEPTSGNLLPPSITVSGVTSYTWNAGTGALTLTDVTGAVSISISAGSPQTGSGATVSYAMITTDGTTASYSTGTFSSVLSSATPNKNTLVASSTMSGGNGVGVQAGKTTANGTYTAGITSSTSDYSAGSTPYVQFSFDVLDGYTFTPTGISVPVQPISYAAYFKILVTDGSSTWTTTSSSCTAGSLTTITTAPSGGSALSGTVNVKIYCYSQATSATGYRFKTPITITGTVAAAAAGTCTDKYSFHNGTDGESDWTIECFDKVGDTHEWQITDFEIPDKPNYYVGKNGSFYNDGLNYENAKSYTAAWEYMFFAASQGDGSGTRPRTGEAVGAVGTVRVYDNSAWDNLQVAFVPDGYKLKIGSTEYPFAVESGHEYRSGIVEYSSSNARDNVSVGIVDASGDYVSTANSEGMQHIFLNTGGNDLWSTSSVTTFGLYDDTDGHKNFTCLMTAVPGVDFLYEGWVPSTCTNVIFCRLKSTTLAWGDGNNNVYDYTNSLVLQDGKNYWTVTGWGGGDGNWSAYSQKGKYCIWDNSTAKNWGVCFHPYYVLTYDANGGSGTMSEQGVATDALSKSVTVASNGFTAPKGYEFAGWNTAYDGNGDSYSPEDTYTLSANTTLYAQWTGKTYNIKYYEADGVTEITGLSPNTYTCGVGATLATPEDSTCHTFVGWYSKYCVFDDTSAKPGPGFGWVDGCKKTSIGTTTYGDAKFLGVWTLNSHTLTWNFNGGTTEDSYTAAGSVDCGETLDYPDPITKTGYTFSAWSSTPSVMPDNDLTLTASWTANTYTVTLDPDNSGSTTAVTATYDASMPAKLSDGKTDVAVPTFTGYTFGGYYDDHTGAGTQYYTNAVASANTWDKTSATTLYAKWTQTVTLNRGLQGSGSDLTPTVAYKGTALSGFSSGHTAKGYRLLGYYTASSEGTKVLNADGTFAASSVTDYITDGQWTKANTTTLYAQWEDMEITLPGTLNKANNIETGGGLTIKGDTLDYTTGSSNRVDGYTEWKVNIAQKCVYTITINAKYDGTGRQWEMYLVNGSGTTISTCTFGEKWENGDKSETKNWNLSGIAATGTYIVRLKNVMAYGKGKVLSVDIDPIKVTYDANGGTCGTAYAYYAGSALTLPTPEDRDGYVFMGWYNGETKIGDAGDDDYEPTASITLTARWAIINDLPSTLNKSNYATIGGGLSFNENYFDYSTGTSSHLDGYADWKVNVGQKCIYTVTLSGTYTNGHQWEVYLVDGSGSTVETCTITSTYTTGTYTETKNWDLSGISATGTYTIRVKNIMKDGSPKLLNLVIDPVIVTYDANGGTCATASAYYAGSALTLPTPTRVGYTFEGWYNAGTKKGDADDDYTPDPVANITLYAHWTDNISGKVFSYIDGLYGDKYKAFDESGWVTSNQDNKDKTYTNATTGVQFVVDDGSWDNKTGVSAKAISSLAKFKNETTSMSVVIPTGKIATVKIDYGAFHDTKKNKDNGPLTIGGVSQTAISTALADELTNAEVDAALKEVTLNSQQGTLTFGSTLGNIYIGRVSATITGYVITYAAGDYGTGDSFTGTKTAGEGYTISSDNTVFTRANYTHEGWSTSADGSTKTYSFGDTYSTDAALTLYPYWEASCSTPDAPTDFSAGSITDGGVTFSITDAANAGNYDIYYNTSSTAPTGSTDATTTSTSKSKEVTGLTAGTTYYAWVRSVCDETHKSSWVALNPGGDTHTFKTDYSVTMGTVTTRKHGDAAVGGTISSDVSHAAEDATVTLTATPTSGYTFIAWKIVDGSSVDKTDDLLGADSTLTTATFTMPAYSVTVKATFAQVHAISYKDHDKTTVLDLSPTSYIFGVGVASLPTPTKEGYTFDSWYSAYCVDYTHSGEFYDGCRKSSLSTSDYGSDTYYASWTAKSYTLTLDKNHSSASAAASTSSVDYDATSFTPTAPTYDGHSVDGYYTSANCTTLVATAAGALQASITVSETVWTNSSSEWKKDGAATFYAHWKCNTPSISCTDNEVTITVPTGSTVYYTTNGSTPTAGSLVYDPSDKPTISANTTIKAIAIQSGCTSSDVASEDCTFTGDCEETTLFSMVVDGSASNYELAGSSSVTNSDDVVSSRLTSISGGTLTINTLTSSKKYIFDDNCLQISSNDVRCDVELSGSKTIQAGDIITITTRTAYHPYITASSTRATNPTLATSDSKDPYTYTLTVANTSAATGKNLIGASTLYLWKNSSSVQIHSITITRPCVDATHSISYDKGEGTGTMSGHASIAHNGSQTLTSNSFTAPDNYTFAGWVADVDVTIGGSTVTAGTLIANGATITNITSDIALTAKWKQTITLDANTANHGSGDNTSAVAILNGTALNSISHTTAASGYKLAGYYTDATSGTKVLNADGSFASTAVTDYISDSKWTRTGAAPTLYAQYEASGSIKWNLQVNSADAPIVTSSKNSSYTQISTSNMTNLDSIGLNITASKKSELTSLISTPDTKGDDCMYVTFKVATGYKFTPSLIKAIIQPVGNGEHKAVEFSLADESSHTLASGSATKCDGTEKGKKTTVTLAGDGTYFTGTVTLKIFVYKHADGTNSTAQYRLGTPIQIDGAVEATCTMPSYESVSYSQTEYTVGDTPSSISVEDATGDPTYQWKYNSTGDRSSGTNGVTTASMSPSTASAGTTYYWCELTNACGTVKTPAVAITVSASKSDAPSIAWTDPASVNYGGGGYTIRATVNDDRWNGNASDLTITAPAGIRIYNTTTGTDGSSKKYIEVKFDVQTAFDRETYSSNIPFTVSADATASYNAISADHNVSYSACSGGGGSATEELMPVDDEHMDNSTWKGGWVYDGIGMMRYGHGSSDIAAGKDNANLTTLTYKMESNQIDTYYKSSANHFGFYTEKAITGIRLYVYTSNDNVTVSGVYVGNSAIGTGTPSTGAVSYEAEYNDDNDALRSGTHSGSAWVDITFASEVAAKKYGQINLSKNVNIAGMAFISASGSGATLTTTLAWSEDVDDDSNKKAVTTSDASFTITASPTSSNSNTLGAITYSSNHPEYAAVNATTGQVTLKAEGTAQITATLAASGCYKSATATYTVVVSAASCTEAAGTVTAEDLGCDGMRLTVSDYEAGATIQWYKDGVSLGESYRAATCTVTVAGTYYAVTHKTCDRTSNSIELADKAVTASKLVDGWYVKNGRITPDIALVQTEGAESFIVKSGETTIWDEANKITTGFAGCGFELGDDGIIYLRGAQTNGSAPSGLSAGDETLTITAKVCSKTASVTVVMHKQIATAKPVLAFVVTGTEKGGFTEGITSAQTTGVDLYNEIAKNFDVLATNVYSTDDEQKLKEYYSQFDILCITDYPNTKTKGVNKKSYVDAIGSLIDIRPILTMEAWVSGLTNWKSKGISGTPKSPTTRQYSMLLQCKDHEIFSGTNPTTVGSGDETMYRIDMVDKTLEDYATLDATYGAGAHEEKSGYEYGSKPALQGFTYDASMSSLLPIGRIDDGAGNDLEVGVERQEVMEARLLVLGINGYAMERLEDDGQTIVINALKYLLKKDAEDISDCSNYFVGGAEGDPYSWKNPDNWSGSTLPDRTQEVRIVAPCIISDTIARANSVKIITGGKFNHGSQTANGSLTINPTGSLIVDGKIYAATAPNYFEKRATEPEHLIVKADADHTGTLIFDNEDGDTQATIEMYSPSHWEIDPGTGKYVKYWSYVGMPIKDVHIPDYFYGAFTYYFNEAAGWQKRFDNDIMQPFEGIGLSMQAGHKETFYGTMVSTENTDITITNHTGYGDGDNLIGNSWTAPIQIANFDASDFGSCWATVYIFNTGKGGNTYVNANADNDGAAKAGQWLGVPIGVAALGEYTGLKVIPAMNAFLVHDTVSSSTTLHLDYDKLVREDAVDNAQINEKMRAPRKKKDVEGLLRIRVVGEKTNTDVWMLQDARFSEGFDNGWEAYYNPCDDRSAQLYARSAIGAMCFLALPDLDGTTLGFAPSRDGNDYTFTFQYRGEDEYYLNDLKLQQSVLIDADNTYDFTYEKGDANRFYISRTPLQAPQNPTGIDNTQGTSTQSVKAIKVIYNDKLYIIRGGRVYSADGSLVK